MDAIYIGLFRSLINHSCLPNVTFVSIDNKVVTVIKIPVKAGEQLLNCYYDDVGPNHESDMKTLCYNFICDCQLCIDKSHQYKPIRRLDPFFYTKRKCLQTGKEILKGGWNKINTNAKPEDLTNNIAQSVTILRVIADFATFPC